MLCTELVAVGDLCHGALSQILHLMMSCTFDVVMHVLAVLTEQLFTFRTPRNSLVAIISIGTEQLCWPMFDRQLEYLPLSYFVFPQSCPAEIKLLVA